LEPGDVLLRISNGIGDRRPAMKGHDEFGIPSVAAICGHPIHPMLVPLPIGFFSGALLSDLAFASTGGLFWATASAWLIAAGLVTGIAAAAVGLVDFLGSWRIRDLHHAWYHLIGNIAALAVAMISLLLRFSFGIASTVLPWGVLMSAVVVGLLVFTGWHGGEMVFGHGVGVKPHEHSPHRSEHFWPSSSTNEGDP
jgi:uncharacterized membrane protein